MAQVNHTFEKRNHNSPTSAIAAVRAELIGSNCAVALGIEAHGSSPVLELCRILVEAGHDPATPLEAYRGDTLALLIRSIGEAARLEVSQHGVGFVARRERRAGSSMRANGSVLIEGHGHAWRVSEATRPPTPDAAECSRERLPNQRTRRAKAA
jgi:hypothetical protein